MMIILEINDHDNESNDTNNTISGMMIIIMVII